MTSQKLWSRKKKISIKSPRLRFSIHHQSVDHTPRLAAAMEVVIQDSEFNPLDKILEKNIFAYHPLYFGRQDRSTVLYLEEGDKMDVALGLMKEIQKIKGDWKVFTTSSPSCWTVYLQLPSDDDDDDDGQAFGYLRFEIMFSLMIQADTLSDQMHFQTMVEFLELDDVHDNLLKKDSKIVAYVDAMLYSKKREVALLSVFALRKSDIPDEILQNIVLMGCMDRPRVSKKLGYQRTRNIDEVREHVGIAA